MHRANLFLLLLVLLAGCQSPAAAPVAVPTVTIDPPAARVVTIPTETGRPAASPLPSATATPVPLTSTPAPTSLPSPTWFAAVRPMVSVLPPGARANLDDIWYVNSDAAYQLILAVPYETETGWQIALVGQPRGQDLTHKVLWSWETVGMEPAAWQAVTRSPVYGTFLGQDARGQWRLVYWDLPRRAVSLVAPLANPTDFTARFGWGGLFVRDGERLVYYRIENNLAMEQWSADNAPAASFELARVDDGLNGANVLDLTGDGRSELVIYWGSPGRPMAHIYRVEGDTPAERSFHFMGEMPGDLQSANLADGLFAPGAPIAYLAPDDPANPTRWQTYHLAGERFEKGALLQRPQGAPLAVLAAGDALPPLPEDLYFLRNVMGITWYRLPASGGEPLPVNGTVELTQRCGSSDSIRCLSPKKKYLIHDPILTAEGAVAAVRDQRSGISKTIPGSDVQLMKYDMFAWQPDERYALLAQAVDGATLERINPATAGRELLFSIGACGFDPLHCLGHLGATDPVAFPDGSYGFAIQSPDAALYPGPGIYRLSADGQLTRLVETPPLNRSCGASEANADLVYGQLAWSADRSMFLYQGSRAGEGGGASCRGSVIILGRTDGSAAWDLSALLEGARDFTWAGEVAVGK